MKSKEPKQLKEKKSEVKPRKVSEKAKRVEAPTAGYPEVTPHVFAPDQVTNGSTKNGSANGATKHSAAEVEAPAIEMVVIEADPSEELIRMRAYQLFADRGYEHGRELEDWLAAERELKVKHRAA